MAEVLKSSESYGLHKAINNCRLHQVRLLVDMGSNADSRDKLGRTPLMIACTIDDEGRGLKMVRIFLQAKVDVNRKDIFGRSALSYAAVYGRVSIATRLIQEDTTDKNIPDRNGDTPLNLAASKGHIGVTTLLANMLIRDGLAVDTRNNNGCTALLLATKHGHYECAKILLEQGNSSIYTRDSRLCMNAVEWAQFSHNKFICSIKRSSVSLLKTFKGQQHSVESVTIKDLHLFRLNLPPIQFQNLNKSFSNSYGLNPDKTLCIMNDLRNRQKRLSELVTLLQDMRIKGHDVGDGDMEGPLRSGVSSVETPKQTVNRHKTKNCSSNHDLRILFEIYQNQLTNRPSQISRPPYILAEHSDMSLNDHVEPDLKRFLGRRVSNCRRSSRIRQQPTSI